MPIYTMSKDKVDELDEEHAKIIRRNRYCYK